MVVVLTRHNGGMSNKPITIKVSTAKLLSALTKALDERKKTLADNEKSRKDYEKAIKDFTDNLTELFRSGKGKVTHVSKTHFSYREKETNSFDISVEFPASIKPPTEPEKNDWSLKSEIEELENAIAILNLSDEEYASTNTYKGVSRFIK